MTNGEKLKATFPCETKEQPYKFGPSVFYEGLDFVKLFQKSWWNAEYKEPTTKNEAKYCDRNICLKNEYNNIGCEDCEVTKSQESTTKNDLGVDCIDRNSIKYYPGTGGYMYASKGEIDKLPSVTTKNDLEIDCISRQEVLRLLANGIGKTNTYLQTEVLKMASVTPQEPRWIPVSERLPEDSEEYLVSVTDKEDEGYKQVRVAWFAHPKDYDIKDGEWRELLIDEVVTAWMPLPSAYMRGEEK